MTGDGAVRVAETGGPGGRTARLAPEGVVRDDVAGLREPERETPARRGVQDEHLAVRRARVHREIGTVDADDALLGVKIAARPRVPASFFVTIAYMCWACRRQTATFR